MSIYHNNAHLVEDRDKFRFLVDRQQDIWTILLVILKFDSSMTGEYAFVASNEEGYDQVTVKLNAIEEPSTTEGNNNKAPQLKEKAPETINMDPAQKEEQRVNF